MYYIRTKHEFQKQQINYTINIKLLQIKIKLPQVKICLQGR